MNWVAEAVNLAGQLLYWYGCKTLHDHGLQLGEHLAVPANLLAERYGTGVEGQRDLATFEINR